MSDIKNNSKVAENTYQNEAKTYLRGNLKEEKKTVSVESDPVLSEDFNERLVRCLELAVMNTEDFHLLNLKMKTEALIRTLKTSSDKDLRTGCVVALLLILKKYGLSSEAKTEFIEVLVSIVNNYLDESELFLFISLESLSQMASHENVLKNAVCFLIFIGEINYPEIQRVSINALFRLGYEGIKVNQS